MNNKNTHVIVSPGFSYKPEDLNLFNNCTTWCINHASRGYVDLNIIPDNYCFLDHPMTFSQELINNPDITKHCSVSHSLWLQKAPNTKLYTFDRSNKPKDSKNHWYDNSINPFTTELVNYPYLTFLFTLQLVMKSNPSEIYFYGCDFIIEKNKNYYFDSELSKAQYLGKKKGIDTTLIVFNLWLKYINIPLYSLSKISRLNEYIEYKEINGIK